MNVSTAGIRTGALLGVQDPALLRDELLPEIFVATARRVPDHTAIVFGTERVTYAELDARADRVARALRTRGVRPGQFVGLWMSRSLDLHVALLGILKSGAAYIPFDMDAPPERIGECLQDCEAQVVIIDATTAGKLDRPLPAAAVACQALLAEGGEGGPLDLRADGVTPADPAYAIYTSGSTGKPKGIVIEHRNICHCLRSTNAVYGMTGDDVVFQGASVAFDLSLEEIFIPYLVGATLWVASSRVLGEVEKLPALMAGAGISVLDTVPTLLAMMPQDVPSLRIIILGGEACPPSVKQRWCRPGRAVFNSYGPTEATVVATVDEVTVDGPVTIGVPIPNYTCYVVDEQMQLLPPGVEGELLIGGPGVARGYLKRPELTAEKFIANPFGAAAGDPVLYRSGDAVSLTEDGRILFHGRIDDQVKLRGFRMELGEIEARLSDLPGIAQATVVLRRDDGIDRLVAFVVPDAGKSLDRPQIRAALKATLPPYMVPSHFEEMAVLPRLTSGKADRKTLKVAPLSAPSEAEQQEEPETATEAALLAAAKPLFPGQAIPFDADFFADLGGHSLLAATFLATVRANPDLPSITLEDLYSLRTLRAIAAQLDERERISGPRKRLDLSFTPPPLLRRVLCGAAQLVCMPLLLLALTGPWLTIYVTYQMITADETIHWYEVIQLMGVYMLVTLGISILGIVGKRLVLWRATPGRYPLWGFYFFRWWLARQLVEFTHLGLMQGTPLAASTMRLLGAKVGKRVTISGLHAGAIDLMEIGDDVTIGAKVSIGNAEVIGNELVIGRVVIGKDAYIGTSCALAHDTVVEEGAELADLTALLPGTRVPAYEVWDGSPAAKAGTVDPSTWPDYAPEPSASVQALHTLYYGFLLIAMPAISLLPIFPAFYVFDRYDDLFQQITGFQWYLPILAWPTAMIMMFGTVMLVTAIRWIVLPRAPAGTCSIYSGFYIRKWTVALAAEVMLESLSSLFSTIYMRSWYRMMGAKIGRETEIATNFAGRYDTIVVGEKCFVADEVTLGDEDVRRGWMTTKMVRVGNQAFIGNDSVLPPGACIPDGALIGIKSKPPANEPMLPGETRFGSPPIRLPGRQRFDTADVNQTFRPPLWRRALRAVFELFAASLPTMLFILVGTVAADYVLFPALEAAESWGEFLPTFIAVCVACSFVLAGVVLAIKWLLMGTYKPGNHGLYSWRALRTEAMTTLYWGTAGRILLDSFRGTPMLPWALRLFGAKIGKGVFMDSTDITEFDCVRIGDYAAINATSNLQTHLFEDRVMKIGEIDIGTGVSIGALTTVLYDTKVGAFSELGVLTIVMKGEAIPPHTRWTGAPAQPLAQ
ncbi:Pls/PosA family non-ribosomal peptide synthetase [Aquabacter spiritensis]|uniref:Non-ribosomal peptide synthetase-like protein n=1 Tax=Aquabacter spiritensis TaxID=933073 RepID=A0A4R3LVY3_9HYPH|nr:Pls/PosA family non-ribosomal peptide synthetase [Aquabacter spiritensis]TCT04771.1 non-ribosomal peptide synthetase-like protein [Aquabacter spiritensis]